MSEGDIGPIASVGSDPAGSVGPSSTGSGGWDADGSVGWDADPVVAGWPGLPSLEGAVTADACVVGLGGSGLAAVDALLARGLSVIGVDAGRVAAGAAGRNGGFLLGGGAPSLVDAIRDWGRQPALNLYRATLTELDRLIDQLGPEVIRRVGSIRLAGLPGQPRDAAEAADRDRERADCAAELVALTAAGVEVEKYSGPLGDGLFLAQNAVMNPARRALGLASQLRHSTRLFERTRVRTVSSGAVSSGGVSTRTVETDAGRVSAGIVIVAVDGRLEVLLPQLAPLIRTARLQMLATAPVPARLPCPVYGRWGYDYGQQDAAGRLYVGGGRDRFAVQEWTTDATPTAPVQEWIADVATRMADRPVEVTHRWAASVGFTTDGRALCVPISDGVVAIGGYSGTGNLVGPVAARAAVALAVDGTPPPPYLTSRLP